MIFWGHACGRDGAEQAPCGSRAGATPSWRTRSRGHEFLFLFVLQVSFLTSHTLRRLVFEFLTRLRLSRPKL